MWTINCPESVLTQPNWHLNLDINFKLHAYSNYYRSKFFFLILNNRDTILGETWHTSRGNVNHFYNVYCGLGEAFSGKHQMNIKWPSPSSSILSCIWSIWLNFDKINPIHGGGEGQFDPTLSDNSPTFKLVHIKFWNFLTLPKYQKRKFWKNLDNNFFTPTPTDKGGGY